LPKSPHGAHSGSRHAKQPFPFGIRLKGRVSSKAPKRASFTTQPRPLSDCATPRLSWLCLKLRNELERGDAIWLLDKLIRACRKIRHDWGTRRYFQLGRALHRSNNHMDEHSLLRTLSLPCTMMFRACISKGIASRWAVVGPRVVIASSFLLASMISLLSGHQRKSSRCELLFDGQARPRRVKTPRYQAAVHCPCRRPRLVHSAAEV